MICARHPGLCSLGAQWLALSGKMPSIPPDGLLLASMSTTGLARCRCAGTSDSAPSVSILWDFVIRVRAIAVRVWCSRSESVVVRGSVM